MGGDDENRRDDAFVHHHQSYEFIISLLNPEAARSDDLIQRQPDAIAHDNLIHQL